jgi:hypothetical protein
MNEESKGWLIGLLVIGGIVGLVYFTSGSNIESSQSTTTVPIQSSPSATDSPTYNPPTFRGYSCTIDCSGHEAGYNWAEEKGITDPDDCDGNSDSFIEGCRSYAEENRDF